MAKDYLITNNRFMYIGLIVLIMFIGILVLFYLKADEVTKDPCSICAEKMGDNIRCTTDTFIPITRTYFPDGSITQDG